VELGNLAGKTAATFTCGAILVGAVFNLVATAVIPSYLLHHYAHVLNDQTKEMTLLDQEGNNKVDNDKEFRVIEDTLKPSSISVLQEPVFQADLYTQEVKQKFGHQLYPLMPGYNEYVKALKAADKNTNQTMIATMTRMMNNQEFHATCDMVTDLKAGLDVRKSDGDGYTGKYHGNAGWTPDNFQTFLKACGDDQLQYLDELNNEHKKLINEGMVEDTQP
jgi:hypothetical protein